MRSIFQISILFLFLLAGCTSASRPAPNLTTQTAFKDVSFKEARRDLTEAIRLEAQWKVVTPYSGPKPVSLAWLMTIAQQKRDEKDVAQFQEIINLVSAYARLGIAQAQRAQSLSLSTLSFEDLMRSQ